MSSDLKARIRADLTSARKDRDKPRVLLLTTTLAEVRNREIADRSELSDAQVTEVVAKAVKQRREAAQQMKDAGRTELAGREEAEAALLASYLPEQLSEDAVREMVREIVGDGAQAMGQVMGQLMPRLKGRFDGKEANKIVREVLGA